MCLYVDDVLQGCKSLLAAGWTGSAQITSSELNQRNYPVLTLGPQNTTPVSADMDMYVKDVQIWTCANWQGQLNTLGSQCNGSVLTSAP